MQPFQQQQLQKQNLVGLSIEANQISIQDSMSDCKILRYPYKQSFLVGVFSIDGTISTLAFSLSQFINLSGSFASILYLQNLNTGSITFTDCTFKNTKDKVVYNNLLHQAEKDFASPSMVVLQNVAGLVFNRCTIQDSHYASKGAFIDMSQGSSVQIFNTVVKDLSSGRAGAIVVNVESSLGIVNSTFEHICSLESGVIQVSESSTLKIDASKFIDNQAIQHGVFKISERSDFEIKNTYILGNRAQLRNSVGQIFEVHKNGLFENVVFQENVAWIDSESKNFQQKGALLEIVASSAKILFKECTFKDNLSQLGTPNLLLNTASNIKIENSIFKNSPNLKSQVQNQGGFIYIISQTSLSILNSAFISGKAIQGGAIYIQGSTTMIIVGSLFSQNQANLLGGALYAESIQSIRISGNTRFTKNKAIGQSKGDAIFAANSIDGSLSIIDSEFTSFSPSNFIFSEFLSSVSINSSNFSAGKQDQQIATNSAGLHLKDISKTQIEGASFIGLTGTYALGGGALIFEQSDADRNNTALIKRCTFNDSSSLSHGGGMAILNVEKIEVTESLFSNSRAEMSGGAIYYSCSSEYQPCSVKITRSNFRGNRAGSEGGAIKWTHFEPILSQNANFNNSAALYGDDMAGIARFLVEIDKSQVGFKRYKLQDSRPESFQSGGIIQLYLAIVDKYGQFVKSDRGSKLMVKILTENANGYNSVLESRSEYHIDDGFFMIDDLVLIAAPNSTQVLQMKTNGINLDLPDNKIQQFNGDRLMNASQVLELKLHMRECKPGEQLLQNGRCQPCPEGKYLLNSPPIPTLCKQCQSQVSLCLGGAEVFPLPGYWRSSYFSDTFYQCQYQKACIGRDIIKKEYTGSCAPGYEGVLCADCSPYYSKFYSSSVCSKCPSIGLNVFLILLTSVFFIVSLVIIVRQNLRAVNQEKNYLPVFFRIMLNHIQILSLTASFDLEWPQELQTFFKSIQPLSDASSQLLSIDCFLNTKWGKPILHGQRLFAARSIILALMPIILIAGSCIVWWMIHKCKHRHEQRDQDLNLEISVIRIKNELQNEKESTLDSHIHIEKRNDKSEMTGKLISTIIVVLFIIHPTLTREMFRIFKQVFYLLIYQNSCNQIEGISRLYYDLETVCYSGNHLIISFWVAFPSIFIYSIGIPTLGFIVLYRNRKRLTQVSIKQRYGFLFNGYKSGLAQYWEVFIIYWKVIIIFIQIFLVQRGKITQALVTLIFLITYIGLLKLLEPYQRPYLTYLEILSLTTSAVSVYIGVFFISKANQMVEGTSDKTGVSLTLFLVILASHVIFFGYWIYCFFNEIRATLRKKYPRIYTAVFLCCKKENYEIEKEIDDFNQKLQPFIQKISELRIYINERLKMYQRGQIPKEDMEFRDQVIKFMQFKKQIEQNAQFKNQSAQQKFQRVHDIVRTKTFSRTALLQSPAKSQSQYKLMDTLKKGLNRKLALSPEVMRRTTLRKRADETIDMDIGLFDLRPTGFDLNRTAMRLSEVDKSIIDIERSLVEEDTSMMDQTHQGSSPFKSELSMQKLQMFFPTFNRKPNKIQQRRFERGPSASIVSIKPSLAAGSQAAVDELALTRKGINKQNSHEELDDSMLLSARQKPMKKQASKPLSMKSTFFKQKQQASITNSQVEGLSDFNFVNQSLVAVSDQQVTPQYQNERNFLPSINEPRLKNLELFELTTSQIESGELDEEGKAVTVLLKQRSERKAKQRAATQRGTITKNRLKKGSLNESSIVDQVHE
ncbi:hypothetical protein FGO68_gene4654 [Halteria grandinella]|uniref:Right handed beta helix domain-containing protein n=1 Tax=Halteria grandinella TaxID=5974 RepID=A0A8J8TAC5_HALGN|nr:hypothetical protein FGO68_gene4654 [Halteria grandinella]